MGRKKGRLVCVTQRDTRLFEYLFLHRVATAEQIRRDIFGIGDLRDVLRRLRALIKSGYIQRVTIETSRPSYAYYLTEATFKKYLAHRIGRQWTQLKSDSPLHDITLIDIRKRFMQSPQVRCFLTENAIESHLDCPNLMPVSSFLEMHSDGAIIFDNDGKFNIAIEYEHSAQNSSRYGEQLSGYYVRPEIHGVIYISDNATLLNRLMELDRSFGKNKKSKIFFGKLSEILKPRSHLAFFNTSKDVLQIE